MELEEARQEPPSKESKEESKEEAKKEAKGEKQSQTERKEWAKAKGKEQGQAKGKERAKAKGKEQGQAKGKGKGQAKVKEKPSKGTVGINGIPHIKKSIENGGRNKPINLTGQEDLKEDPKYNQLLYYRLGRKIVKGVPITTIRWISRRGIKYINKYRLKSHLKY